MRAVPAKGPPTCPSAIPPGGTPPKGQLAGPLGESEQRRQRRHPSPAARGERAGDGEHRRFEEHEHEVAEHRELDGPGEAHRELADTRQESDRRPPAQTSLPQAGADDGHADDGERPGADRRQRQTDEGAPCEGGEYPERPGRRLHVRRRPRTDVAARSPLATHAGIPIPPSGAPASSIRGTPDSAARARSILRRCPGRY